MKRYVFPEEKRSALESLRQPFAIYQFIDKRVVTLLLSDGFCDLFGYKDDRASAIYDMDNDMYRNDHPDDVARIADDAVRFATEGGTYDVVYRTKIRGTSDYMIVHAKGEHVYMEDGTRLAQVWYTDEGIYVEGAAESGFEITRTLSNALHEQSIVRTARYDDLTGLPNMSYFFELAEAWKKAIQEKDGHPVLLYIDFSGMKFFNSKYGFAEGNRMLKSFARLLVESFSNENSCRIGADHFAVIAEEDGIEEKLKDIFHGFGELYGGKTPPVNVGIYPYRVEDVHVSSACDGAKLACSTLKGSYVSGYSYYSTSLREDTLQKQYVIETLDTAIREKWIQVYLQPIIRIVNGRVCDVEALARWIDPEKGMMSPGEFIPVLEQSGLIYKLDLYMLDRILEMIRIQKENGFHIIPHSINLSRSDFEACDIVEEIRSRVDAAGIDRDRITIEITESVIGSDFEFMKDKVHRFRELGFPVWMDDFGSGYSSLDVLQSIKFDLIKFDMSFMRKLDEGKEGKIILTELMRMATALGVDTVCEGVETESQARFLKEIGCSKLQGFYYSRPIPFETILERKQSGTLIENENPEESDYYESIGRVNLFDLGVITSENENALQKAFDTIPIAILEVKDDRARYVRNNRSYQDFISHSFHIDMLEALTEYGNAPIGYGEKFVAVVRQCCENGDRAFFDEKLPDDSVVHTFVSRIGVNPVTGSAAVVVAVLSITEPDDRTTYVDIAKSLAADYYNIFVIDLDTNEYDEYSSRVGGEELSAVRHGMDFFESARRDTMIRIFKEDRETFLKWFTRDNVLHELDTQGAFTTTYRLIDTGEPMYVNMKITRMQGGNRLIIGISIIDAQMKLQEEDKRLRQEKTALGRIAALAGRYIALYLVDVETEHFLEYNSSKEYDRLGLTKQGEAFFTQVKKDSYDNIYPEDIQRHLKVLTKENMLKEIRKNGLFFHNYRLLMNGKYVPITLRAALIKEDDGEKLILGVSRLFTKEQDLDEAGILYSHIAYSLARDCTDLYYVNIDTDEFIEYNTDDDLGVLTQARRGSDFFEGCERDAKLFVHPEDQAAFVHAMNRDFLRDVLDRSGVYELTYRRIKNGRTFCVRMKVSRIEDDRRIVVIAVYDIGQGS